MVLLSEVTHDAHQVEDARVEEHRIAEEEGSLLDENHTHVENAVPWEDLLGLDEVES